MAMPLPSNFFFAQIAVVGGSAVLLLHYLRGRRWAWAVVVLLVGISAWRPQWGREAAVELANEETVWFAVDVSRSMLARDASPDRLTFARGCVAAAAPLLPGRRLGLLAFAGGADLACPPTRDAQRFADAASGLSIDSAPPGGSRIRTPFEWIGEQPAPLFGETLVLFTDGGDAELAPRGIAELVGKRDLRVVVVGVGDANRAHPIPLAPNSWLLENERMVFTRLEELTLRNLAAALKGVYLHAQASAPAVAQELSLQIGARGGAVRGMRDGRPAERFQWLLLPATITAALLITRAPQRGRFSAALIGLFLATAATATADAGTSFRAALLDLAEGRFGAATTTFRELLSAPSPISERARFGLGNALIQTAAPLPAGKERRERLMEGIAHFRELLEHPPDDFPIADLQHNLETGKRLLAVGGAPEQRSAGAVSANPQNNPGAVKDSPTDHGDKDVDQRPENRPEGVERPEAKGGAPLAGLANDDPGPMSASIARAKITEVLRRAESRRGSVPRRPRPRLPHDY